MSYKGYFRPLNPEKYTGNVNQIVYRSGWELQFMMQLDSLPSVIRWSSEEIIIPYRDPFKVGNMRRYFVDFKVEILKKDGTIKHKLIEIKPHAQTQPPKNSKSKRGQLLKPAQTFIINQAKWKAASEYCAKRGWEFEVITEKHIPSFVGKKKTK